MLHDSKKDIKKVPFNILETKIYILNIYSKTFKFLSI